MWHVNFDTQRDCQPVFQSDCAILCPHQPSLSLEPFFSFSFFFLFCPFRATPEAYGGSQARGGVGATAAGLHHSHSDARSELHL